MTGHDLDEETAALLPLLNSGFPRVEEMTGAQARAAVRARLRPVTDPIPMGEVLDRQIPGPAGDLSVRIYRPVPQPGDASTPLPVIVFAHGGGFVFCDLDSHDDLCRSLSAGTRAIVVSVDYRLAPDHRWPAALDDVYAATVWAAHAEDLGGDPRRVIVAGDSAGGNLAAATAITARDAGGPALAGQLLLYPVLAADFDTDSYGQFGAGFYNTAAAMRWYWDCYVPDVDDRNDPRAAPLRAELTGLPPAVVVTAGHDPLWSEGVAFVDALRAAGVSTVHRDHPGAIHGFLTMPTLGICARARTEAWTDLTYLVLFGSR